MVGQSHLASQAGGPAAILTAGDVQAIIETAAGALADDTMAVAVVDRAGTILGVYVRPQVAPNTANIAVSLARTTAYFSNDQAPLSSRTVRFISGIHFPPGVPNVPNAALYGVENINRGCDLGPFNRFIDIDRPRSIAGTFGDGTAGATALPCNPGDTRGCAVGGPIEGLDGASIFSLGITTGKPNLRDDPSRFDATGGGNEDVNPGAIPLYRGSQLIGGVGIAGVSPALAQFAALSAAAGTGRGITTAMHSPIRCRRPARFTSTASGCPSTRRAEPSCRASKTRPASVHPTRRRAASSPDASS